MEGKQLFHTVTTLHTKVSSDCGDICGYFNNVIWVVALMLVGL